MTGSCNSGKTEIICKRRLEDLPVNVPLELLDVLFINAENKRRHYSMMCGIIEPDKNDGYNIFSMRQKSDGSWSKDYVLFIREELEMMSIKAVSYIRRSFEVSGMDILNRLKSLYADRKDIVLVSEAVHGLDDGEFRTLYNHIVSLDKLDRFEEHLMFFILREAMDTERRNRRAIADEAANGSAYRAFNKREEG